jgi:arginine-tRNA-protein transferase
MAYKTRYRPIEVLGPRGWALLEDDAVPAAARVKLPA